MYCVLGRGPKFRLSSKRGQKSGSHVSVSSDDALYVALEQAYTEFTHRQYPGGRSLEREQRKLHTNDVDLGISNDLRHPALTLPHFAVETEMNCPDRCRDDPILRMMR